MKKFLSLLAITAITSVLSVSAAETTVSTFFNKLNQKELELTVHHYIEGTTTKLADDVVTTQKYTTSYTTEPATVNKNYELIEIPKNASGEISGDVIVTYYYKLKEATLTVNHYIEGTKTPLASTTNETVYWGETYTTSAATDINKNYEATLHMVFPTFRRKPDETRSSFCIQVKDPLEIYVNKTKYTEKLKKIILDIYILKKRIKIIIKNNLKI